MSERKPDSVSLVVPAAPMLGVSGIHIRLRSEATYRPSLMLNIIGGRSIFRLTETYLSSVYSWSRLRLSGPVWLPKIYNGHNRTFFSVSYEGLRRAQGARTYYTVPTAAERTGDFSKTLSLVTSNGVQYAEPVNIYLPLPNTTTTTQVAPGQYQLNRQQASYNGVRNGQTGPIGKNSTLTRDRSCNGLKRGGCSSRYPFGMLASHQLTEQQRKRMVTGHHLLGRREMVRHCYWPRKIYGRSMSVAKRGV
jgi:hypothetical protein